MAIGAVEVLTLLHDRLHLDHGFWAFASSIDLNTVGFLIVGLFGVTWAAALLVWRYTGIEERWSPRREGRSAQPES